MSFKITGTGSYVPDLVVTNDDLSKLVETSDEWIAKRVGVRERRISVNQTTSQMGFLAAQKALQMSGTSPKELDLIITASITGESVSPSVAGMMQHMLGANCPAFDVSSACSGFIFALETAAGFFARGYKKILVTGAERVSKIVDWSDRSTCVIFGDGAGSAVLEAGDGYIASKLYTKGGNDVIDIPSFGGSSPFYKGDTPKPYINMDGQQTFKFAVNAMTEDIKEITQRASLSLSDLKYIVPHQANIRIIQFASKKLCIDEERFFVNIDKYGNTSSASVPIALDELNRSGKLNRGDYIALCAFGGGLSSGSCIIKW